MLPGILVNEIKLSTINYHRATVLNQKVVAEPFSSVQNTWKPTEDEWLTINTDEAVTKNKKAGCGGVIINHKGDRISGFSRNVGTCDVFQAELWNVFEGSKLAYSSGINKAEFQVDNKEIARVLTSAK